MLDHRKSAPDEYYNSAREKSIYYSYDDIDTNKAGMAHLYMYMRTADGSLGFQTFEGLGQRRPKTFLCMKGWSISCFLFFLIWLQCMSLISYENGFSYQVLKSSSHNLLNLIMGLSGNVPITW